MELSKLFEHGSIGKMETRNRLVMAPMGLGVAHGEDGIADAAIDFFVERAKGGVGLIIVSGASIVPEARHPRGFAMYSDKCIPDLRRLCNSIQTHGAKVFCQLGHLGVLAPGVWHGYDRPPEIEALGPSPVAGFDGVEINAAHGHFLAAFISPFKNRRTDEYGESLENRARFTCEAIACCREEVGPDFPVILRFNGSDFFQGGTTLEDALYLSPMFVEAGADALDVSASAVESWEWKNLNYMHPDGALVHLATAIKKTVDVPVITVGKIGDPILAERILREGKSDFVAMCRALVADPELPNKARTGRLDDIRRCIYCNNCRPVFSSLGEWRLACTVNPELLREREYELKAAPLPKKVMVIGGGLAGMEAAIVLGERGHSVTLYEKTDKIGGQWNIACLIPSKNHFHSVVEYLASGLKKAQVNVVLNTDVTKEFVEREGSDAVIVATGATAYNLDVPGAHGKNVCQAVDVFQGSANLGRKVVVVGGNERGMEVAALLATQGKQVFLATRSQLGRNVDASIYVILRDRLISRGVHIFPHSPVYEIRENGIYLVDTGHKQLMFLEADNIVLAVGSSPEDRLVNELKGVVAELYSIGDCHKPRNARDAINEGAEVGRKV